MNINETNIHRNLQNIIILNSNNILSEFYHSPEMYKILLESKTRQRPTPEQILPVLFQEALANDDFIKRNYHILIKENISPEEQSLIYKDLMENIALGVLKAAGKIAGKAIGWTWKKVGDVFKWVWEGVGKPPTPAPKPPPTPPAPPQIPIRPYRPPPGNPMDGYRPPKHGPGGDGLPYTKPQEKPDGWMGPGWWREFGGGSPPPPPSNP